MALILEVLDARSGAVAQRLRLDALPLTIGRGYDNDLILDDRYVDAHHARIALDEEGAPVAEDLGSLNGLRAPDTARRMTRASLRAGTELRVGRTVLRFRDPAESVPPALPDLADEARIWSRWRTTTGGRAAVSSAAVVAIAAMTWLGSFARSSASDVFAAALVFLLLGALWAGVWAVASRIVVQRFQFLGHFAVLSAVTLAAIVCMVGAEWATFLFPDSAVLGLAGTVSGLALLAAWVAGHLALASSLPRRRRWSAGLVTSGVVLALGGAAALAGGDAFSDVPEFPGVLKPVAARWVPAISPAEFGRVTAELKAEVDALAAEE